ncbi:unnamed protein product [Lactuca saligna]|uniref:Uncharacterized protein n=1 Tax=Lactuca saligna TaxID=75948 RepID=A0AA35YHK4_LACSI|nr:unnamed protein product [Lactuca saligna]
MFSGPNEYECGISSQFNTNFGLFKFRVLYLFAASDSILVGSKIQIEYRLQSFFSLLLPPFRFLYARVTSLCRLQSRTQRNRVSTPHHSTPLTSHLRCSRSSPSPVVVDDVDSDFGAVEARKTRSNRPIILNFSLWIQDVKKRAAFNTPS